jgi:hypothetical protein
VTENNRSSGSDPIGDFQRWLMRSSAKNLTREIKGTVRRTLGGNQDNGDVWGTATTEPPPTVGEAPECAWCPVCRAARRFRDSGPGLASHAAAAGDALLSVAQDTISAFEATLATRPPGTGHNSPAGTGWPGQPTTRPPAEPTVHPAAPAAHEPAPASSPPASPESASPESASPESASPGSAGPSAAADQSSGEGQKAPDDPDHRP